MKTLSLKEALTLVIPGPYKIDEQGYEDDNFPFDGPTLFAHNIQSMSCPNSAAITVYSSSPEEAKTKAALLAHAFNTVLELTEALDQVLKHFVTTDSYPDTITDEFITKATVETRARLILAKANTITLPEQHETNNTTTHTNTTPEPEPGPYLPSEGPGNTLRP